LTVAQRQGRPNRAVRKVQRVAAYAVIIRDDRILLSRLAQRLSAAELWTLPGGGVEHGEDPRDAVVREVHEETGLAVQIGETAHVYSAHQRNTWRQGRRADAHSLRIVYDGWVPIDSPEPRVLEIDGSTQEAAWKPLGLVMDGTVPTVSLVPEVLAQHRPFRQQRVAAYALALRESEAGVEVLLTRNSARGPHPGIWTLPGGGVRHGEDPRDTVRREVREEAGLLARPGRLLDVASTHSDGTAPSGRREDFHALQIVFDTDVSDGTPRVIRSGGTTDEAAWVRVSELGSWGTADVVTAALAALDRRT
jgi:8-oxo-dGTP diphosphatase